MNSFNIVLIEPEIPQNTGNIGRTCVATRCALHLVGKLGFKIDDSQVKRAGLDYWEHLEWYHHPDFETWWNLVPNRSRVFYFSTKSSKLYTEAHFQKGDWLVFGKETKGLDPKIYKPFPEQTLKIPQPGKVRSLNLATAVAVSIYEGIRQIGHEG